MSDLFNALIDALLFVPRYIYHVLIDAAVGFLQILQPIASSINNAMQAINSLPAEVVWALNLVNFGFGFSLVLSAWAVRFFIRRIPFIG